MKKTRIAAVSIAAVMACGLVAGCDLVTTDPYKDYEQVIAEVDITKSEDFAENGVYNKYKSVITTAEITKRDMVESFSANGSSVMNSYGWSYYDTFEAICDSLVNRAVYVQYMKIYCLDAKDKTTGEYMFAKEDGSPLYTVAEYEAAVAGKEGYDAEIAGLTYFLTEDEAGKALYDLRVSFNNTLDSQEQSIIDEEDDHDHATSVRTTPAGVNTENEDYYDDDYIIYTGTQIDNELGSYEKVSGSQPAYRRRAYARLLSSFRSNGLLNKGEDTSNIENLVYFKRQLKSAYESALIGKIADAFEEEAERTVTPEYLEASLNSIYQNQLNGFEDGKLSMDDALDGMSDTSFVLTAPKEGYGFVINILLPFSTAQSQELGDYTMDSNDIKGNKFITRASILKRILATDQRETWFTGHDDYSYEAEGYKGTLGNNDDRSYLFFEDALKGDSDRYETLKNYYGKYSYNGSVKVEEEDDHNHYTVKPKKINIDQFIDEMEGYLGYVFEDAGVAASVVSGTKGGNDYYNQTSYYGADGKVDYSKFVYYSGKVEFEGGFNASEMFLAGSKENVAFSVINELSFAYNTDTAGLNSYLGYAITPDKTNFVSEFEYAAQQVCKKGAGNYMIVPSDYGWHIIYCTFSFTEAHTKYFEYDPAQRDVEGTFSNLFYEASKASAASTNASNKQTEITNKYAKVSSTIYKDRYADLSGLDSAY